MVVPAVKNAATLDFAYSPTVKNIIMENITVAGRIVIGQPPQTQPHHPHRLNVSLRHPT